MSNVTVYSEDYENIQGVAVKKIKVTAPNLKTLLEEGKKSRVVVEPKVEEPKVSEPEVEEVKPRVVEEIKPQMPEEMPLYMNSREAKKDFEFDETALKEKVAENYKNLANYNKIPEKKTDSVQKLDLDEKINKIKKMLSTSITIMADKKEMIEKVFNVKSKALQDAKAKKSECADEYRRVSDKEQKSKNNKKTIEDRLRFMNDKKNFLYLTIGESEDNEMVSAISGTNESLKYLYNINQKHLKLSNEKIDECENRKKEINKASEEIGLEIAKAIDELSKFIDEAVVILENIIRVNNQYEEAVNKSEVIANEYNAIAEEENAKVGININTESQDVIPNINQSMNVFENFRQAASEGGNEAAVGINDSFMNSFEQELNMYGRASR